jgi:thiol-disulfide isomerase/thioredoxin
MKNFLCNALVLLFASLLFAGCMGEDEETAGNDLQVGDSLPSFSVVLTVNDVGDWRFSGSTITVSNSSLKGKKAVIVFFNTSCPDCQEELPIVQKLYDMTKSNADIEFLCISREEDEGSIRRYWSANRLTLPYSPQTDKAVFNLFAGQTIPRIYITDTSSVITSVFTDSPITTLEQLVARLTLPGM